MPTNVGIGLHGQLLRRTEQYGVPLPHQIIGPGERGPVTWRDSLPPQSGLTHSPTLVATTWLLCCALRLLHNALPGQPLQDDGDVEL